MEIPVAPAEHPAAEHDVGRPVEELEVAQRPPRLERYLVREAVDQSSRDLVARRTRRDDCRGELAEPPMGDAVEVDVLADRDDRRRREVLTDDS